MKQYIEDTYISPTAHMPLYQIILSPSMGSLDPYASRPHRTRKKYIKASYGRASDALKARRIDKR
jgi:hypothetical protein